MPIPFILGGAAAIAGTAGIKKGIDAIEKNNQANRIKNDANMLLIQGVHTIEMNRIATNEALEKLGDGKVKLLKQLERYVVHLSQIRHIDFEEVGLQSSELQTNDVFRTIKDCTLTMTEVLTSLTLSAGSGALVAFGAYSGAMVFGTASTGVAMNSLAGVAATNATLAFLGGGSLMGGYGIAGGTAVLGGLIIGPAMVVGGFALESLATTKLENAKTEAVKAQTTYRQQQIFAVALENIETVVKQFNTLLLDIRKIQMHANKSVMRLTKHKTDWSMFTQMEKEKVHTSLLVAQLSKGLLETDVLDADGGLLSEVVNRLKHLESMTSIFKEKYK